ncbi:MAG: glycoside hydrolase family 3 protein, partial [Peptostreptococcaceae bacterium]
MLVRLYFLNIYNETRNPIETLQLLGKGLLQPDENTPEIICKVGDILRVNQFKFIMTNEHVEEFIDEVLVKLIIEGQKKGVLQENSKIPLLIAANTEGGGNGACVDGTYIACGIKTAATNDKEYAYQLGRISAIESAAIGCNWSFAPVVDLMRNWRNPIIATRGFSADADKTLELSLEFMRGMLENGVAPAAKHFPGDGIDERNHHLSFAPNWLSVEEWDESFGKVYGGLIDAGLPSIMAGHIALPEYVRYFNPKATKKELLMPTSLNKYILTDLLRGKMGFNGLVVTDASHMVAMTSAMKRKYMLPTAIAAGSDLFLFFNDPDEDFKWMMEGYENGIITDERLEEALTRILGTKAALGLHEKAKTEILQPKEEAMAKIGLPEYKIVSEEIADKSVTLVKNEENIFPLSTEKHKRVLLVDVKGINNGMAAFMMGGSKSPLEVMKEQLEEKGFEVEIYVSEMEKLMQLPKEQL